MSNTKIRKITLRTKTVLTAWNLLKTIKNVYIKLHKSFLEWKCLEYLLTNQGHPTTVFCNAISPEKEILPRIFLAWIRLIISRWAFHSGTDYFRSLSTEFPTIFWGLIFSYFTPYVRLIFVERENLIFSDSKMWWREREIKNYHFRKRSITA